jgi:hypothetical protein
LVWWVAVALAFAAGLLIGRVWWYKRPDGPLPLPPLPPPVKLRDPETGETHDYYEGASKGDDSSKPAEKGELRGPMEGKVATGKLAVTTASFVEIALEDVRCNKLYRVWKSDVIITFDNDCGGPAAMQKAFDKLKDEVLTQAMLVSRQCKRQPSCDGVIRFQSLWRKCRADDTPPAAWVLSLSFEVTVNCVSA